MLLSWVIFSTQLVARSVKKKSRDEAEEGFI
jgi:hypothetical protein